MDHPTQPRGDVRECASWRSCIMAVHRRHAGEKLGYGGVYTLDHDADVAIVGVGYGDGLYLPLVEMHGDILVRGERRPMLACCMDQCMVDVTGMEVQIRRGNVSASSALTARVTPSSRRTLQTSAAQTRGARSRALSRRAWSALSKTKELTARQRIAVGRIFCYDAINYNYSVGRARI